MKDWFTVENIDADTFAISEYRHWEETHAYLLIGRDRSLLIDTGLGVCDISAPVRELTKTHVTAVPTHVHWDHIGGLRYFKDFCVHRAEKEWITGSFPLPVEAVRAMLSRDCELPPGFDLNSYGIFYGRPSRLLEDGEVIDLGGRSLQVIHTPGHSPGHMCLWERERGYLFTGDLVYAGTLYADYPSTDPEAYLASVERIARLPAGRLLPGHHSLDVRAGLAGEIAAELRSLRESGKLAHGAGRFDFPGWSIAL